MIKNKCDKKAVFQFISKILIFLLVLWNIEPINNNIIAAEEVVYKPISVSGFNADVIAEDLTYKRPIFALPYYHAENYTSTTMDTSVNVLYTNYVSKEYGKSKYGKGLPDDGVINSEVTKNVKYIMQPYDSKNVLQFTKASPNGTLKVSTDDNFEKLYFLTMSANGTTYCDVFITFTDGSTSSYKYWDEGGLFTIHNWIDDFKYAISNIGRISRAKGEENTGNIKMDESVIELREEDQKKVISSIEIISGMQNATGITAGIFAVTGKVVTKTPDPPPDAPVLNNVTNITQESAALNWSAVHNINEYHVDVATDRSFSSSSILNGYNNITVWSNSLNVSGLKHDTTYYYRVRAKNSFGTSENSNVGTFKTLSYEIYILKHPDSITVEENNINETLYVEVSTNSKKPLIYAWYLCRDELGADVIRKDTVDSTYVIPSYLLQGDYYIYCEIYNEDISPIKTNIAKVSVEVIYNMDLSWGEMKFQFGADRKWNPKTHLYEGEDTYSWNKDYIDGENNKITISNHSSSSLSVSIEYFQKEGAFNEIFNPDTSVQGRLYKSNEEAVKASGYLSDLTKKLTFGNNVFEETLQTNKWEASQNFKSEIYFAFSGMPDLNLNQSNKSEYESVGYIQMKFKIN